MPPKVLVLRAPGANCDGETVFAFERAGAAVESLHVNRLLEDRELLSQFQIVCIPGGFSYGDDLAAGRILGTQMRERLGDELTKFRQADKLILGICNGFQVLMRTGLLVADDAAGPRATLTWNESGRFQDRWVRLKVEASRSPFFEGIESMYLPIAHAEGKFVPRDARALDDLGKAGQCVLRYVDNPNGSVSSIAGVCDPTGRICGLMPHPERHIDPQHHPRWTRGEGSPEGDGLAVFRNAVRYFG